jgi:uncharacterized membrane protein YdjX (TVP38/TMEM64 family)
MSSMVGAISGVVLSAFATFAVYRTWVAQQVMKVHEHDEAIDRLFFRYEQEMRE